MSNNVPFSCPIEGCKWFDTIVYADSDAIKRHLYRDHDYADVEKFAFDRGIINDPVRFHNHGYVINQIVKLCRLPQNE